MKDPAVVTCAALIILGALCVPAAIFCAIADSRLWRRFSARFIERFLL